MTTAKKTTAKKTTPTKTTTRKTTAKKRADEGFTPEEKAAMKEYARERRGRARNSSAAADLAAVEEALEKMPEEDRALCRRLHEVITAAAPELAPRTWYGMPAYAKDGKVLCFVQNAGKFKARYTTLGFQDTAALDAGAMWPTAFAVTRLTATGEKEIAALVRRAVG